MSLKPKLTIITVNLNNASGLQRTIDGLVNQSFSDYEHVIIDGGSTDSSVDIIKSHTGNLTYWVSEPDNGIYNAMNKGVRVARGEYLQFLNSGDWLVNKDILSKVFEIPRTAVIIYGNIHEILPGGRSNIRESLKVEELTLANFNTNSRATIQHPAAFIHNSLFGNGLYDEKYKIIADIKFFIDRIIMQNCTVEYIPDVITNFNLEGLSSNPSSWAKTIEERNRIFEELLPPRIYKDYDILFKVKDSPLLEYIPFLENTTGLKKLITKCVCYILKIYNLKNKLMKPLKSFKTKFKVSNPSSTS